MMDSDVGWRPTADGRSASIRPGGALLSARAPSLLMAEFGLRDVEAGRVVAQDEPSDAWPSGLASRRAGR